MPKLNEKIFLYFAIVVSPMGASAFSFQIGGVQMTLFRLSIILAMIVFIIKRKDNPRVTIYHLENKFSVQFMWFWLIAGLISGLWAIDLNSWFRALFFIFIGVLSMELFINSFNSFDDIKSGFIALNIGVALQSFIGWYEIITKDYRFVQLNDSGIRVYINGLLRIPIAMKGNPNDLATLMLIGFFAAIICSSFYNSKLLRFINYALAINYAILIVSSTSRANIIGLILALGFCMIVLNAKKRFIIIISLLLVIFLFPDFIQGLGARLGAIDFYYGESEIKRFNLIRTGFQYLLDTYGLGVGAGQFESWVLEKGTQYYHGTTTNMHNWWMELLTTFGVLVFVVYITFYMKLFKDNLKVYRNSTNYSSKVMSLGICAIMVGYVIGSISSSSNIKAEDIWVFWSLCIAYQGIQNRNNVLRGKNI